MQLELAIVVPTFNERENVVEPLARLDRVRSVLSIGADSPPRASKD